MKIEDFSSIQILAMRDVLKPSWEATYRQICRHYSKTFHTPLTEVLNLDLEFVLQHYLEDAYAAMEEDERLKFALEIVETDAERAERLRLEAERTQASIDRASSLLARATQKAETVGKSLANLAEDFGRRMVTGETQNSMSPNLNDIEAKLRSASKNAPDLDFEIPARASFREPEDDTAFGIQPPPKKR